MLGLDVAQRTAAVVFGALKGVALASTAVLLNLEFWKALVIAVVAAVIGVAGSLLSAWYSVREVRANREISRDIQRKVGASQRRKDDD